MRPFVVAVTVLLGCSSGNQGTLLEGTTAAEVVEAPAPGRSAYSTHGTGEPVVAEQHGAAVARGIWAAAERHGIQMEGDGRLGLLAAWTAERLREGGAPPDHEVVEFFSRHLGLVEPAPHILVLGQPDPSTLEASVADSVGQFLERQPYNRYGASVIQRQGLTLAVVTLSWRFVELEDIPRSVEPGASVALSGQLLGNYRDPVIAIAPPQGSVERIVGDTGQSFEVTVPTGDSGVYQLEILAQGPRGSTVVANFPLYVGTEAPTSVSIRRDEEIETDEPSEVVAALTRLVNRARGDAGLPPVQVDPELATVAEAHSQDMVENDFIAHTSTQTGTARDRVGSAGIQTGLVLENIGRGYGPVEIHRGLLESPGHRANILNPDVTHIGVGVVAETEGDRTAFVATELFVHMTAEIDSGSAPEVILGAVNRVRRARGSVALEAEENLSEAAQRAAERFIQDPSLTQQEVVDDASGSLRRFGIAWSRVGGLLAVVTRLDEAADFEPSFDPDVRYVGIGVAQGTRPDTPANAITVVILLAWPR